VQFEIVEIVLIALEPHLRHALGDSAFDARTLISGEVEAAGFLDELEHVVKRRSASRIGCHLDPP
jgi:hypothetical protein